MHEDQALTGMDSYVLSPCVRNCCLNDDDICLGCFRSIHEIEQWNEADNRQRTIVLKNARERREVYDLNRGK